MKDGENQAWQKSFRAITIAVMGLIAPAFPCMARAAAPQDPVAAAIREAEGQKPPDALRTLLRAERLAPRNAQLLTQLSEAWSDCVEVAPDKAAGERAAENAIKVAEQAIEAAPRSADAHVSLAIASGKMTDFVGNSRKMALSKRIRDEALRAVELDSRNADAYYILGRWNYGMANLNPLLRIAAQIAYGSMPPASMEDAVGDLEKSVALAPVKIDHRQALALAYQATRQHDKAVQQWKAILELPAIGADDERAKKEARAALGK